MLHFRQGVRVPGISTFLRTSKAIRERVRLQTTVLSANNRTCTQVSPIPFAHNKSPAAFSTRSHGLRKIMFTDLELGNKVQYKQRARPSFTQCFLDQGDPFDDPEAQNCMAFIDTENRYLDSSYVWTDEAADVQRELNKLVRAAGKTTEWPVVLTTIKWTSSSSRPHKKSVIVYKVPSGEDVEAFAGSERSGGLSHVDTKICSETPDGTFRRMMNEWWHHFLLRLPKKQKYW